MEEINEINIKQYDYSEKSIQDSSNKVFQFLLNRL
jgi:hypothetical protein